MKILFECDDGCYVVEVMPSRLYARVHPDKEGEEVRYDGHYSLLLNPASFHEYRGKDKMLQNRIDKLIAEDLQGVL